VPLFVAASSWPDGDESGPALSGLAGFQVQAASPASGNGIAIPENGGVDFWDNPLYNGAPDIGPYEAP
jgi:hypothetical protein